MVQSGLTLTGNKDLTYTHKLDAAKVRVFFMKFILYK